MQRKHVSQRDSQFGFTLLEILIALFVFTIVSVIMTKALHTVFDSQARTEQSAARLAKLQTTLLLLSHEIEQTIPRQTTDAGGSTVSFVGTAHEMTFVHGGWINPLSEAKRSTLQRIQYAFADQGLMRTVWSALDATPASKKTKRLLMDSILELQFAYLDSKGQLQSSWPAGDTNDALPRAIQLSMTLKNWGIISQLFIIPGASFEQYQ